MDFVKTAAENRRSASLLFFIRSDSHVEWEIAANPFDSILSETVQDAPYLLDVIHVMTCHVPGQVSDGHLASLRVHSESLPLLLRKALKHANVRIAQKPVHL